MLARRLAEAGDGQMVTAGKKMLGPGATEDAGGCRSPGLVLGAGRL